MKRKFPVRNFRKLGSTHALGVFSGKEKMLSSLGLWKFPGIQSGHRFIQKILPVVNEIYTVFIYHCVILLQDKLHTDCCLGSLKNLFISFIYYCLLALGKLCLALIFVVIKLRTSLIWPPNCL